MLNKQTITFYFSDYFDLFCWLLVCYIVKEDKEKIFQK